MPTDSYKPRGPLKSASIKSGGADAKDYPIIGIVKDNIDPLRSGRIRVALQDGKSPLSPDDSSAWVTVQYLTTFFGTVRPTSSGDDLGSYKGNPSSYGQWQAPPDIGTKVICIFVNGDINAGYYIGAIPEPETLHMVPAFGAAETVTLNENEAVSLSGATRLPTTNINTNNSDVADSDQFLEKARPVHSYTASVMSQQGVIRDPIRGPISTSASRETSSRVGWGVSTPGRPIYEGGYDDSTLPDNLTQENAEKLTVVSRRGGHSIIMDDGDIIGRDQLIRIRTALGHQILMSDDGQTLMLLHSNGQSYIELGKEGTVDIYSTNSINMRTEGDFNIHADRDINLHAEENLNIKSKNMNVNTDEEINLKSGKDFKIDTAMNYTVKAKSAIALNAQGQASLVASAEAFVNGSKVNLNSGSASLKAFTVTDITKVSHTDSAFDKELGWLAAPGQLISITSRAPAHCPWVGAGLGVDINTSPSAEDKLPQPASPNVTQINQEAAATNPPVVSDAAVATAPEVPGSSKNLDKNSLGPLLGAAATVASQVGLRKALGSAAGVITQNASAVAGVASALKAAGANVASSSEIQPVDPKVSVGVYDRDPKSLADTGVLKPGADKLINSLAKSGKAMSEIMPQQLFTGKEGAENISKLAKNIGSQTTSMVNSLKVAEQQLIESGLIKGTESPTQTGGVLLASAVMGTDQIISQANKKVNVNNVVRTAAQGGKLLKLVSSSNLATKAQEATGVFAGLLNTVDVMKNLGKNIDTTLGATKASFDLIKSSFTPLEPKVPQYLPNLEKKFAIDNAIVESSTAGEVTSEIRPAEKDNNSIEGITGTVNEIARTVPRIAASSGSLGGFTRVLGSATATVNTTVGALNSIESIVGGNTQSGNNTTVATGPVTNTNVNSIDTLPSRVTTGINTALTQIEQINSVTGNVAGSVNTSISKSIDNINSLAGAASSLKDGLTGLSNSAKNLHVGSLANKGATLASGITKIPGGLDNIASTGSKLANDIGGLTSKESISGLKSGIINAVKSLLPIDAVSDLLSSIGAIGKGGKSPIKLPSVASNTRDRSSQKAQVKEILNDKAIPDPDFGGEPDPNAEQKIKEATERLRSLSNDTPAERNIPFSGRG